MDDPGPRGYPISMNIRALFLAFRLIKGINRWRERRRLVRAARELRKVAVTGDTSMSNTTLIREIISALIRHSMTASPFLSALISENQVAQIAGGVVGVAGFAWSAYRKWKRERS